MRYEIRREFAEKLISVTLEQYSKELEQMDYDYFYKKRVLNSIEVNLIKDGQNAAFSEAMLRLTTDNWLDRLNHAGIEELFDKCQEIAFRMYLDCRLDYPDSGKITIINDDPDKDINIYFTVYRDPVSYDTVNGKNKSNRGKDLLIFFNKNSNNCISIPISSVPTMSGTDIKDAIATGDVELTLGPLYGSKYSPNVFTISGGKTIGGELLSSDGTTKTNKIPWRGHDTNYFDGTGCFVGKSGNTKGNWSNTISILIKWGLKYGDKIKGKLITQKAGH